MQPSFEPPQAKKTMSPVVLVIIILGAIGAIGVIGVLVFAGMAAYGVTRYTQNAKSAEARATVGAIMRVARSSYAGTGKLCPSASSPVPASVSQVQGRKYMSSTADWEVDGGRAGFSCLHFTMTTPQYYQYMYEVVGDQVTVTAVGDLNGDGKVSRFMLRGKAAGGDLVIAPAIEETDPTE